MMTMATRLLFMTRKPIAGWFLSFRRLTGPGRFALPYRPVEIRPEATMRMNLTFCPRVSASRTIRNLASQPAQSIRWLTFSAPSRVLQSALSTKKSSRLVYPTTIVMYVPGASTFGFVPGDNDGPVFDNTLPTFFTNGGGSGDTIGVWEVTPDWDTPENTTLAEVGEYRGLSLGQQSLWRTPRSLYRPTGFRYYRGR